MSGFNCGTAARLLVQVSSESALALHRHCPHCKLRRRFVSSGKFRVNAQKKRIDAWLIFRCTECDDRWNWPVHARRAIRTLDPTELDALMQNDPALAIRQAEAALRQHATADASGAPSVALTVLKPVTAETKTIEIVIAVTGAGPRLDRLLARALMLGRREIEVLDQAGAMTIAPAMRKALRRPVIDGQRICLDLAGCSEAAAAQLRRRLAV